MAALTPLSKILFFLCTFISHGDTKDMINDLLNHIIPSVEHFRVGGYWIAFFAALFETTAGIGLILPGSTIILILGALSARGYLDLGALIWFAVLGAIIGDNVNYYLGKRFGVQWLKNGLWFIKPHHLEKSRHFMDAHGAKSIFLGRFIPSLKEVMPFIAGSIQMNVRTFMFWNILGAIGWGFQWVLAGYIFAQSLNIAELWLSRAGLFLAAILILGAFLYGLKWLIIRKGKAVFTVISSLWHSAKEPLLNNQYVKEWIEKRPKGISFLHARLNISTFSGLPLSIMILAFVYVVALFGGIVEDLVTAEPIVMTDIRVANLLVVFRTESLTAIFSWITLLGKSQVVIGFIAVSTTLLLLWRKSIYIIPLFIAAAGSVIFTHLGKITFHRPRPDMAIFAESSFSFPSGHATIALALYGFLSYILIRLTPSWQRKVNIFFAGILITLAIGLSRIYLGVHYLSDVWSGYLVGAMWLIIAISFCEWLKNRTKPHGNSSPMKAAGPISLGLILTAVLFYGGFAALYHPSRAALPSNKVALVSNVIDVFENEQMKYTETVLGEKQEPVNFIILAEDDRHLVETLQQAGWGEADLIGSSSLLKAVQAFIAKSSYPSAPISLSFWDARTQDFSFVKQTEGKSSGDAHHLRVWKSMALAKDGRSIFVGVVNGYAGRKWGVLPRLSADIDSERELLYHKLDLAGKIQTLQKEQLVKPQIGTNFTGDQFFTDGKMYIVSIL